jgi:hypothetical protein
MLRLTKTPNLAIATLWADALVDEGIPASVQRQRLFDRLTMKDSGQFCNYDGRELPW